MSEVKISEVGSTEPKAAGSEEAADDEEEIIKEVLLQRRLSSIPGSEEEQIKLDFGDIECSDLLGQGRMSEIYSASMKERVLRKSNPLAAFGDDGLVFAIKCINRRHVEVNRNSAHMIASVLREKKAMYRLRDVPFVLRIMATARSDTMVCLIYELCANGDLRDALSKFGPLSLAAIRYYGACLISALKVIHARGLAHRDVKPENVLLRKDWSPRLSDFGCVKIISESLSRKFTSDRERMKATRSMTPSFTFVDTGAFESKAKAKAELSGDVDTATAAATSEHSHSCEMDAEEKLGDEVLEEDLEEEREIEAVDERTQKRKKPESDPDFVGTPEFMAPELMTAHETGGVEHYEMLDLWSLGMTLNQLATGKLLIAGASEWLTLSAVSAWDGAIPREDHCGASHFDALFDCIGKLLKTDPTQRISLEDLCNHAFFKEVDFETLPTATPPPLNEKFSALSSDS